MVFETDTRLAGILYVSGGQRIWLKGSVIVLSTFSVISMMLIWDKAERSAVPTPADVNPLAWPLVMTMLALSPSIPVAQEKPCDSSSDKNSANFD